MKEGRALEGKEDKLHIGSVCSDCSSSHQSEYQQSNCRSFEQPYKTKDRQKNARTSKVFLPIQRSVTW
jgi:hypothetical protein